MSTTVLGKVSITPKGAWSASTSYEPLDVVSYGGSAFLARRANSNVTPTEGADWQMIAEKATVGNIAQTTGTATDKVMSQNAATVSFALKNDLSNLVNGYTPTWNKIGYIAVDNGALNSDQSARNTGYIGCELLKRFKLTTFISSAGYAVAFYDENKNILADLSISGLGADVKQTIEMDIPSGVKYMVCSEYDATNYSLSVWNNIQETYCTKDEFEETVDTTVNTVTNGIIPTWDKVGYVASDSGIVNAGSTESKNTGYIDCKYLKAFKLKTYLSSAGYAVAFYDESKNILADVSVKGIGAYTAQIVEMNIPSNARYMICSEYNATDYSLELFNYNQATYAPKSDLKKLHGKKVMFFGDSITEEENRYRKWLLENTDMVQVESFAISGALLTNEESTVMNGNPSRGNNNTVPNQVLKMLNGEYETPDIVIVSAGTNGGDNSFSGAVDETQFIVNNSYTDVNSCNLTKVSGAMRWIYEKIIGAYPNAQVFFATPIQGAESSRNYSSMLIRRNAITAVANRMSVNVIDAFEKSGIYGRYEISGENGKYLADGLHPNVTGGKLLAKCYQNEIESNIK